MTSRMSFKCVKWKHTGVCVSMEMDGITMVTQAGIIVDMRNEKTHKLEELNERRYFYVRPPYSSALNYRSVL